MDFEYNAIDQEGRRVKGLMKADSMTALANIIRKAGGTPLMITSLKKDQVERLNGRAFTNSKHVPVKELAVFTRQLGSVLSAGVTLSEAVETIASDLENKYFSDVLRQVLSRVHAGESFSAALSYYPAVFSSYYVAIVRSGEEIGNLGKTMSGLAGYIEKSEAMHVKLISAIRYPVFLLIFLGCTVFGIVFFLIPRFKTIFEGAGVKLPLLTRIVVGVSEFMIGNALWIILGIAFLIFIAWKVFQIFQVRFIVAYFLLRIPIIGDVIRKSMVASFCQTLAMLLEGGVGLIAALTLSAEVIGNLFLRHTINEVRQSVTAGGALSDAMLPHADIPRTLIKMIAVGEKSGTLPNMIGRMGDYYDKEVEAFLNDINSLLEPIFIILIGSVVLLVALALYLPIFGLSKAAH